METEQDSRCFPCEPGVPLKDNRVKKFLKSVQLVAYLPLFQKQQVSYDDMINLSLEELSYLGLPFGPSKRIKAALSGKKGNTELRLSDNRPDKKGDSRVLDLLQDLNLVSYYETLRKEEITLEDLEALSEEELEKMGFPKGPRSRIIRTLRRNSTGLPFAPPESLDAPSSSSMALSTSPSSSSLSMSSPSLPFAKPSTPSVTFAPKASTAPSPAPTPTPTTTPTPKPGSSFSERKTKSGSGAGYITVIGSGSDQILIEDNPPQDQAAQPWPMFELEPSIRIIPAGELKEEKLCGEGNYSKVCKGRWDPGEEGEFGGTVAIRTRFSDTTVRLQRKHVREVRLWSSLIHPNVVRLFGIAKATDPTTCVEVCEFMDGNNIGNRRVEICCLPTVKRTRIALNVATGLHYLHSRNIVHGDLHTYNILLDNELVAKLADFQLSHEAGKEDPAAAVYWPSSSPEVLQGAPSTFQSDIYSFGVCLWEIFSGKEPLLSKDPQEHTAMCTAGLQRPIPESCPTKIAALIGQCWKKPEDRPSISGVLRQLESILDELRTEEMQHMGTGFRKVEFSDVSIGECIGVGAFGKVHQGTWRGAVCAIKVFDLDKIDPDCRDTFVQEFEKEAILMEKLGNHPNVVKFIGACLHPPMLLMEFLPLGCCEKVLKKGQKVFAREQLIRMARDVAAGMMHLHSEHVLHRDLALRNLLLASDYTIKVTDFGLSKLKKKADKLHHQSSSDINLPVKYMAPESLSDRLYSEKTDVYMFGCVLYEMVTREEPYKKDDYATAISKILKGDTCPLPGEDLCPPIFREIIHMCWQSDPANRPTFAKIFSLLEANLWHLKKEESLWAIGSEDSTGYCKVERKHM